MVFFIIDGALELGGILNLAEVYPDIRQIYDFHNKLRSDRELI